MSQSSHNDPTVLVYPSSCIFAKIENPEINPEINFKPSSERFERLCSVQRGLP